MQAYQHRTLDTGQIKRRPIDEDITIVIPTLGRSILEESLYWIVSGSRWPKAIIVVDQGSDRVVAALMEKVGSLGICAHYIPSDQRGRASGINRGLEQVKTRFVAITDDDCFVENEWLEQLLVYLREHPGGIVTGRVEAAGDEMDGPTLAKMFRAEARAAEAIQSNPEKFAHYIVEEAGGLIGLKELKLSRILNAPPAPYTRERFDDNYNWTLGWGLVPPGATYENTVDNRAWQ